MKDSKKVIISNKNKVEEQQIPPLGVRGLFLGIDHPALAADDVEKLSDWYCEMFGYEKWFKHEKPVWMLKAPDGTLLEIMPKDETLRQSRTTWTPGWSHLALRVENIEQAIEFLDTKGIVWGGEVINAIGGGKVRSAFDCEGNMIQILERSPPTPRGGV